MELQILIVIKEMINLYTDQKIDVDSYVKEIKFVEDENKLLITLDALGQDAEKNRKMERELIKICKVDFQVKGVKINYLPQEENKSKISPKTQIIAIMSGKGGVGKSNVTVNLANALSNIGKKVAIMDGDIYGYSIPKLTNALKEPEVIGGKIKPIMSENGVEVISAHHFLPNNENKAIIWRGVKLNSLLNHFVYDVAWNDELDVMLIDMPPGTGDILLNIDNLFENIKALYVTTPNSDASYVAERVIQVGEQLGFEQLGIIENMAYYEVDGKKHYIFGKDGGIKTSENYNIPLIASIPICDNLDNEYIALANNIIEILK